MSFQSTGNKVPIQADELISYIHTQLSNYDNLNAENKANISNPYNDIILYITKEGKTIAIPKDIQDEAIEIWKNKQLQQTDEYIQTMQMEKSVKQEEKNKRYDSNLKENANEYCYWKIALFLTLTIGTLLLLFKTY